MVFDQTLGQIPTLRGPSSSKWWAHPHLAFHGGSQLDDRVQGDGPGHVWVT